MTVNRLASYPAILWAVSLCFLAFSLGSCTHPRKRLTISERRDCIARGGYESTSGFGYPLCQFNYIDGNKPCSDKADCQGRCLNYLQEAQLPKAGDAATGICEIKKSTFGCYAVVEKGKINREGAICVD